MTIAIITDTHFGIRKNDIGFLQNQLKFYKEEFFPRLKRDGITKIIHAGDIFDNRSSVDINVVKEFKEHFFDYLEENNIEMSLIVGNHDVYYKNTNIVNSPESLLSNYNNIDIILEPTMKELEGINIMFMPWINNENYNDSIRFMSENHSDTDLLVGHFEIAGFVHNKASPPSKGGMDPKLFRKFKKVISGHFHEPSTAGNIQYIGSTSEYTWADYDCLRGYSLLHDNKCELEFVQNPFTMFEVIDFDKSPKVDFTWYTNKTVRVIISDKSSKAKFNKFLEKLNEAGPRAIEVIDNTEFIILDEDDIESKHIENEDVSNLINSYVESSETELDPDKLKSVFSDLYNEAILL